MNVFDNLLHRTRPRRRHEALAKAGVLPAPPDLCAHRGRAAARGEPRRSRHQCGDGARQGRRPEAARTRREDRGRAAASFREVTKTEIAGPGFINLTLDPAVWRAALARRRPRRRGLRPQAASARGKPVNVEYVSANPTGPMHVGHCRGAVFGDALANLLAFAGFAVTREYYINDAGAQVDVLARSAYLRYREALGEDIGAIPGGTLSGRLSEAGRRGARQASTATSSRQCRRANGCRSCARTRSP